MEIQQKDAELHQRAIEFDRVHEQLRQLQEAFQVAIYNYLYKKKYSGRAKIIMCGNYRLQQVILKGGLIFKKMNYYNICQSWSFLSLSLG